MRMEKWMEKLSGNAKPTAFMLLDCETRDFDLPQSSSASQIELIRGECIIAKWRSGKLHFSPVFKFASRDEFWAILGKTVGARCSIWVYSRKAYEYAVLLGMFDMIEDGNVDIFSSPPSDENGNADCRQFQGVCVTADPPTIIIGKMLPKGSVFKWLDIRNYGHSGGVGEMTSSDGLGLCKSWLEAFLGVVSRYGLGSLQLTAASQSICGWRTNYMEEKIHIHNEGDVLALERAAVYGGRCECRFLGRVFRDTSFLPVEKWTLVNNRELKIPGKIYCVDMNSAYPYAATAKVIPTSLLMSGESCPLSFLESMQGKAAIIADVDIDSQTPDYPVRIDGKKEVLFPVGRFRTVLATPEIDVAIRLGDVKKVHRFSTYTMGEPFKNYVQKMYSARLDCASSGNYEMASCLKSILVGLPGKFSQRKRNWVKIHGMIPTYKFASWWDRNPKTGQMTQFRSIAGQVEYQEEGDEHTHTFPAISAVINATLRFCLSEAIEVAGQNNVFYYDTDSIWTDEYGFNRMFAAGLISDGQLGKWKLVAAYDSVEFCGIKHYVADGELKCAGLSYADRKKPPSAELVSEVEPLIHSGWTHSAPKPIRIERQSFRRDKYRHGIVREDGVVFPFQLKESEAENG